MGTAAEALADRQAEEEFGRGRLRQLIAYARKVYGLAGLLGRVEDSRRKPGTTAPLVAAAVLYTGLLRIRSLTHWSRGFESRRSCALSGRSASGCGCALWTR